MGACDERIDVACPRCGKVRSVVKRHHRRVKSLLCQPCTTALGDRRRNLPLRFRIADEDLEERLDGGGG